MKFNTRERDGVVIIDLKGALRGGELADEFDALIKELLQAGKTKILVNMSKVDLMNSQGLGILIRGYTSTINAGGQYKLMKITNRIRSLLIMTKLMLIFEVFEDEEEAIASFASDEEDREESDATPASAH